MLLIRRLHPVILLLTQLRGISKFILGLSELQAGLLEIGSISS